MKKWIEKVKSDVEKMSNDDLMEGIDILDEKVAKNDREAKAIDLMKKIYWNELQERLWSYQ